MSQLITRLQLESAKHKGTDLGGLLQWAALHIKSQDQALAELHDAHTADDLERLRLQSAVQLTKQAIEQVLQTISAPLCPPVEFARDFAPQINLMAHHGDPDYRKRSGLATGHTDTRSTNAGTKTGTKP